MFLQRKYLLLIVFNIILGIVLAQLVIKAISLMEAIGATIDGVVSDGAQTNRKMWTELGISGIKGNTHNYIIHPMDDNRKLYMFSDTPHLIKCIRNRLHDKKILRVNKLEILF